MGVRDRGAGLETGVAFDVAAALKRNTDPRVAVVPFVVEQHGRFGDEALTFPRKVAPLDPALRLIALNSIYQTVSTLVQRLSLIHIAEPTRLLSISSAVFCW